VLIVSVAHFFDISCAFIVSDVFRESLLLTAILGTGFVEASYPSSRESPDSLASMFVLPALFWAIFDVNIAVCDSLDILSNPFGTRSIAASLPVQLVLACPLVMSVCGSHGFRGVFLFLASCIFQCFSVSFGMFRCFSGYPLV